MPAIFQFLYSEHMFALLIAIMIFLTFCLFITKRWSVFSVAFFLLISLTLGFIINQRHLEFDFNLSSHSLENEGSTEGFHTQMLQALEHLKIEVTTEKENLRRVMGQVQEIFNSMDIQKQKLQSFIEKTHEQFKTDDSLNLSSEQEAPFREKQQTS